MGEGLPHRDGWRNFAVNLCHLLPNVNCCQDCNKNARPKHGGVEFRLFDTCYGARLEKVLNLLQSLIGRICAGDADPHGPLDESRLDARLRQQLEEEPASAAEKETPPSASATPPEAAANATTTTGALSAGSARRQAIQVLGMLGIDGAEFFRAFEE